MRKPLVLGVTSIVLLAAATLSRPAAAADAGAVIGACERDPKCVYGSAKDGSLTGCSEHACFICPADGKHQCNQVQTGGKAGIGVSPISSGGVRTGGNTQPKGSFTPILPGGTKLPSVGGTTNTVYARIGGGGSGKHR
jgi:hypothetical protein